MQSFNFRIVNLSSVAHERAKVNWDDIHYQKKSGSYKPFLSYGQSKLANILHAKELSRRVEKDGIRVYSLHPGILLIFMNISTLFQISRFMILLLHLSTLFLL